MSEARTAFADTMRAVFNPLMPRWMRGLVAGLVYGMQALIVLWLLVERWPS